MRSEAVLDSAVFQLTPTRTRCELVIKSNGKSETVMSGLLNPFLCHLKTAKDQIEKGGYSITLEPDRNTDAQWFTKGTVERFVRFVSTPEILERVNTLELEIIQTVEAIAVQGNEVSNAISVEDDLSKSVEYAGGNKPATDSEMSGKAIILYKPGIQSPESNGEKTTPREESAKVNLLRVLQIRKEALRKEQGMAFARAMAAGFTVENISDLISFAECFGAARLLEASTKFMDLYHGKHETGQWLEIDATDAISVRSDLTGNASGNAFSVDLGRPRELQWATLPVGDPTIEGSDGKVNGRDINPDLPRDARMNGDSKSPGGPHEYFQGQFPHPMYAHWPVHSPPGVPVFQPYAMQGMPFYPNYPPGGPYLAPTGAPVEDPAHHQRRKNKSKPKKRSSGSKTAAADDSDSRAASAQSQDEDDDDVASDDDGSTASGMEKEDSARRESRKKGGSRSGKNSGMVVIKNLNYIASKNRNNRAASGSESSAASEESDGEHGSSHSGAARRNSRRGRSSRRSKSKGSRRRRSHGKPAERTEEDSPSIKEEAADFGRDLADSGHWQVFQSFLLRDEDDGMRGSIAADGGMFSGEKKPAARRKPPGGEGGEDFMLPLDRDSESSRGTKIVDGLDPDAGIYANSRRMNKNRGFGDDNFPYSEGGLARDVNLEVPFDEMESGGSGRPLRKGAGEEFVMIHGQQDKPSPYARHSSDPIAENEFEAAASSLSKDSGDASSFMMPVRLDSPERNEGVSRTALILDSELSPATLEVDQSNEVNRRSQVNYEPYDLSLMPEREVDRDFSLGGGYDPALDYEMESQVGIIAATEEEVQEDTAPKIQEVKENEEKSQRAAPRNVTGKKKLEPPAARGRLSKLNPSAQAQARADKLRAYKADLQKVKKEKEEEAIRRVEALKLERQRRIAARSSGASQSSPTTQQRKTTQSPAASQAPSMPRASKFSDSPGSPSLLHGSKVPVRMASAGAGSDARRQAAGSGVARSVSSLSDAKKGPHAAAAVSRSMSSLSDSRKDASTTTQRNKPAPAAQQSSTSRRPSESSTGDNRRSALPSSSKPADNGTATSSKEATSSEYPEGASSNGNARSSSLNPVRGNRAAAVSVPASKTTSPPVEDLEQKGDERVHSDAMEAAKPETVKPKEVGERIEQPGSGDDTAVVEKMVVVLEHEAPPPPLPQQVRAPLSRKEPEDEPAMETGNGLSGSATPGKIEATSGYAAVRAPPADFIKSEVIAADGVAESHEVEGETVSEQQLSLETLLVRDGNQSESTTPRAPTPAEDGEGTEPEHEAVGKPRSRESLKGLKKLLKFGRKSHGSPAGSELDTPSPDDQQHSASEERALSQVVTTQEGEPPAEGVPTKGDKSASRHFSILSPFRSSKTSSKSSPA
ncbi:COP1-interacting protein-like protein [Wolffia australiana]